MKKLNNQKRSFVLLLGLIGLFLVMAVASINIGEVPMSMDRIFAALMGKGSKQDTLLIWVVRMPRSAVAVVVGITLAVAGAVMQGVTRNPLATPSMVGIGSGASLATLIVIYLYDRGFGMVIPQPIAALGGGIATFTVVYSLALRFELSPVKLILNGIAVNSCIGAVNLILTTKLSDIAYNMKSVVMGGSLTYATWDMIGLAVLITIPCIIFIIYKAFHLNILNLGEEIAVGLGINLKKERKQLLYATVILSSVSAYIAGGIGFIGMIAPHIAKRLVGPNYKYFMPLSICIGANLVLFADIVSRFLVNNGQFVPIGTLISLIGAPYLLYLLFADDR